MLNTKFNSNKIGGNLLRNIACIVGKKPNSISIKLDGGEIRLNSNFKDTIELSASVKQMTVYNSIGDEIQKIEISQSMENSLNLEEREKKLQNKHMSMIASNLQGKFL